MQQGALGVRRPDVWLAVTYAFARGTHALHCSNGHTPLWEGTWARASLTLGLFSHSVWILHQQVISSFRKINKYALYKQQDPGTPDTSPRALAWCWDSWGLRQAETWAVIGEGPAGASLGGGGTGVSHAAAVGTRGIWGCRRGRCPVRLRIEQIIAIFTQ